MITQADRIDSLLERLHMITQADGFVTKHTLSDIHFHLSSNSLCSFADAEAGEYGVEEGSG